MSITIAHAQPSDLDALAVLFDACRQFHGQPSDPAAARDWLRNRLRFGESRVLLARRNGEAAGFAQLYPAFSSVRLARTWTINDLFVLPTTRRQGIARSLLDAAAAFAREDGAAGLQLEIARDNAAARATCRNAGWREDATQWYSLSLG
ncbi:MAG: GNAT family N-acetyltransferase [Luteimonas sp.]|nr:GNAT family N-acetyltransferase [Luteimonas sp.]